MKKFVIAVNDTILYIAICLFAIFCIFLSNQVGEFKALLVFAGGLLIWCVTSGLWFVLSAIHAELVKLNAKQ